MPKAVFGFQCFWSESAFAKITGVLKTRVGYSGGKSLSPTYETLCAGKTDQTEVIELEFDNSVVKYENLVDYFFEHHDPTAPHKVQYRSLILYTDDQQKEAAERALEQIKKVKSNVQTRVEKFDVFHQAEHYHQKYWLRCQKRIFDQLKLSDEQVVSSTLAAKVNAFMAGYDKFDVLKQLAKEHNLSDDLASTIEKIARSGGDPRACH